MTDIGPFQNIVSIRFPTGVSGQYIFDCLGTIQFRIVNFIGTINGESETIRDGTVTFEAGRNEIKGRQFDELEPIEITVESQSLPQYTQSVENWTLFKFFESKTNNPAAPEILDYFTGESFDVGSINVSVTSNQAGMNWFNNPAQPSELAGENLSFMFAGSFGCGDLSNLDMPNARIAIGMFAHAEGVNWNKLNAPNLEVASGMFAHATSMWSTNGDPVVYDKLGDATYLFYNSDIDELIGSVFKAENLAYAFAYSDIEFINGCILEETRSNISFQRGGIFEGCGKLESVINSEIKLIDSGDFLAGSAISYWGNNKLDVSRESSQSPLPRVSFAGAHVENSAFTGEFLPIYMSGSTFDNSSTEDFLEGVNFSRIIDSDCEFIDGDGSLEVENTKFSSMRSNSVLRLSGSTIEQSQSFPQAFIEVYEKNDCEIEDGFFHPMSSDGPRSVISLIDFEFTTINNGSENGRNAIISNRDVELIKNISSGEGSNITSLFRLSKEINGLVDNFGIAKIQDSVIESNYLGHFIIQRRDIAFDSVFITNLSPESEFNSPPQVDLLYYENETSLITNFHYKITFNDCDFIAGKLSISCKEVDSNNSVFQEVNFCGISLSKVNQDFFDSLFDCRITQCYGDEHPYDFDYDVSEVELISPFSVINYSITENNGKCLVENIRNFHPKAHRGNIRSAELLQSISNSSLNISGTEPIRIDFYKTENLALLGNRFYYGLELDLESGSSISIRNNVFGDPYAINSDSTGFYATRGSGVVDWQNNTVYGTFQPTILKCENPTGVCFLHPGSEFGYFADKADYSGLTINLTDYDGQFVLPDSNSDRFLYSDEFLRTLAVPNFVFGDDPPNKLYSEYTFTDIEGLHISKLHEIVDACLSIGAKGSDTDFIWDNFNVQPVIETGLFHGGYNYYPSFFSGVEPQTDEPFYTGPYFIPATMDNIAKCQNRILTPSDWEAIKNSLESVGFTNVYLGATYEIRQGRTVVDGDFTYIIPPHIVVKRP